MVQHEAAIMDGANRIQRVLHVTLPAISGTIMVVFILNLAKILNLFDPVWVLQNPMVINESDVIETYVYRMGISGSQYGISTAAGLFKSVISVAFVILGNKISKKIKTYTSIRPWAYMKGGESHAYTYQGGGV